MEWVELSLPAGELADEVAAIIASTDDVARGGVEVRGQDIVLWVPAGDADAAHLALAAAASRLRDEGFAVDPASVRVRPAPPEDEWRDSWKRFFHVTRIGARVVIVPSWETHTPLPEDVVLDLDPGRAFGTGAHASTRLSLLELERLAAAGHRVRRFLDVGTGSGILAMAAAKLWPESTGAAIDVDPEAVSVARENLERNGVLGRVVVSEAAVTELAGSFDVVAANIQADVLEPMRDALVDRLEPGAAVVLSGLLADQVQALAAHYAARGLTVARETFSDDREWGALVLAAGERRRDAVRE